MNLNELYPSKYMKAEDFAEGETKILTVRNVDLEEVGQRDGKKESKPVMTFRESDTKALVLNKTNAAIIAKYYGDDTDDWLGKKIALHAIEVESFGDIVRAIRVKTKIPQSAKAQPVHDDIFQEQETA